MFRSRGIRRLLRQEDESRAADRKKEKGFETMHVRKFEIFPEIKALEKIVREDLRKKGEAEKIPRMDRLMDNYKLLLEREGEKKIELPIAKMLGAAIIIYASGMPETERKNFLLAHKVEGFGKHAISDIGFAIDDCLSVKKSYSQTSREVASDRNILGALLSLLVHMDELGKEDAGLLSVIELIMKKNNLLNLYGSIPADELRDAINSKTLRDSTERRLLEDVSVVAEAILLVLRTRYYVAPVESLLSADILTEIRTRRMWLRTEIERMIRRKKRNEISLAL
jgi:hypothetical protein